MRRLCLLALVILPACGRPNQDPGADASPAPVQTGPVASASAEGWGAGKIDWQPYDAGLAEAKAQNKPVCLVFSTAWCPHCKNYSHVFEDDKVAEKSKRFVMIHLDADKNREIASKYTPDGGYIPRTFFLAPDGTLARDIHAPRPKFQYFYDERNPASLLGGMDQAIAQLAK